MYFLTASVNGNDWTDGGKGRARVVAADLDEAPFLPDMGSFYEGAFHLHVEDVAETAVGEAAKPSEQPSFGHHLSNLASFRPGFGHKHGFGQQNWLESQSENLGSCFHGCKPFAEPSGGHFHGLQG